jgi:hypothetical protein
MMRRLARPLPAVLLLAGCGLAGSLEPGNGETDRIARVVSDAIGWPRQASAMGYARAATQTTAGHDGRLTVVEVTELKAETLDAPFAELLFLIHLKGSTAGFITSDPVTACYRAEFGFYGLVGSTQRTGCPENATPVEIPAEPTNGARPQIPDNADRLLRAQLRRHPSAPQPAQLEVGVASALAVDPQALPPDVEASADGPDVGVSVRGDEDCLLGARIAGKIWVWRPSTVQMQPGELACDPETALAAGTYQPPH